MTHSESQVLPTTDRALRRIAIDHQRTYRIPGLLAAVARRGEIIWSAGIGSADLDHPGEGHTTDTQVPVASNTKTFTAVLIMQLRDEGKLSLDDGVQDHLTSTTHAGVTIRQLLAHSTGLQREPVGNVWDTQSLPEPGERAIASWNAAERIGRPHTRFHYSNLAYGILGEVISTLDGRPWAEAAQARLFDPLGLRRTGVEPKDPTTGLYYVGPYSDVAVPEPRMRRGGMDSVGSLWSTGADLARWHAFITDPDPDVLDPDTMEEMCQPQIVADPRHWTEAQGLGFALKRRGEGDTIWVGHTGGLPGSITGIFTNRETGTTGIALMNNSVSGPAARFALSLGGTVDDLEPAEPEVFVPGTEAPAELLELTGEWFAEGEQHTFSVRHGRLQSRMPDDAADVPPAVFAPIEGQPDAYRTVSGRERGEQLTVERRADGSIRLLRWATYPMTRAPLAAGEPLPDAD